MKVFLKSVLLKVVKVACVLFPAALIMAGIMVKYHVQYSTPMEWMLGTAFAAGLILATIDHEIIWPNDEKKGRDK